MGVHGSLIPCGHSPFNVNVAGTFSSSPRRPAVIHSPWEGGKPTRFFVLFQEIAQDEDLLEVQGLVKGRSPGVLTQSVEFHRCCDGFLRKRVCRQSHSDIERNVL
jgi:hypothetical protein